MIFRAWAIRSGPKSPEVRTTRQTVNVGMTSSLFGSGWRKESLRSLSRSGRYCPVQNKNPARPNHADFMACDYNIEVFMQDWKSHAGWAQLTKPPGDEGARHSVILRRLVEHRLFLHPDQQRQRKNTLPAYPVGSLRAHVQVECLVEVIDDLVSSDDPQEKLQRFTNALHEMVAFGRSKKHMIQRQLGRLEPTPSLKYRAHEVMRHMPVMST
jgi:hypothetical protein